MYLAWFLKSLFMYFKRIVNDFWLKAQSENVLLVLTHLLTFYIGYLSLSKPPLIYPILSAWLLFFQIDPATQEETNFKYLFLTGKKGRILCKLQPCNLYLVWNYLYKSPQWGNHFINKSVNVCSLPKVQQTDSNIQMKELQKQRYFSVNNQNT